MKCKVYIYPIISFLVLLIPAAKIAIWNEFEFYAMITLIILSVIIAFIGAIQTKRKQGGHSKILSIILILLNLILIFAGLSFWFAYLNLSPSGAHNTPMWKFVMLFHKIIPPFIP